MEENKDIRGIYSSETRIHLGKYRIGGCFHLMRFPAKTRTQLGLWGTK
jgi:hypothetical protein